MTDRNHTQTPETDAVDEALARLTELYQDGDLLRDKDIRMVCSELRRLRTPAQEPRGEWPTEPHDGYPESFRTIDGKALNSFEYADITARAHWANGRSIPWKAWELLRRVPGYSPSGKPWMRATHPLAVQGGITEGEREAMRFYGNEPVFYSDKEKEKHDAIRFGFTLAACVRRLSPATTATGARVWTASEWLNTDMEGTQEFRTGNVDDDGGMLWSTFYPRDQIIRAFVGYTHLYGPLDEQEGPDTLPPAPSHPRGEGV